jgi:hypothetical protein
LAAPVADALDVASHTPPSARNSDSAVKISSVQLTLSPTDLLKR